MGKAQLYLEKTAAQKVTYNPSNKASFSLMLSESLGFTLHSWWSVTMKKVTAPYSFKEAQNISTETIK